MSSPPDAMTLAQVAVTRMDGHEKTCTERYNTIAATMARIEAALNDHGRRAEAAVQRIHDRIDDETTQARDGREAIAAEARKNSGLALAAANDAKVGIQKAKVWALTGILGAIVGALINLAVGLAGHNK